MHTPQTHSSSASDSSHHRILHGLAIIRRWQWRTLFALPVIVLLAFASEWVPAAFGLDSQPFVTAWVFASGGLLLACLASWVFRMCPRCDEPFFMRGWYGNALSRRCLNCGLPLRCGGRSDPHGRTLADVPPLARQASLHPTAVTTATARPVVNMRRIRRVRLAALIIPPIVFLVIVVVSLRDGRPDPFSIRSLIAVTLGGLVMWVPIVFCYVAQCPNCARPFFRRSLSTFSVFVRNCRHCGISLSSPTP